jgi:hypothetical protein
MAQRNWRRVLQIKLRTVLLLVLVLSLPLAWCATRLNRGRQQRPVVEAIEKAGGKVWVVGQLAAKNLNDARLFASPIYDSQRPAEGALDQMVEEVRLGDVICIAFWNGSMRNALPEDGSETTRADARSGLAGAGWRLHIDSRDPWRTYRIPANPAPIEWKALSVFPSLQVLDLGDRPLTDAELKSVGRFAGLRALLCRRANITDEGLASVAQLKNLRVLSLEGTLITDDGLRHLAGLQRLEVLELDHSAIRGQGLEHLAGLSRLKLLSLRHAPLTDDGLWHLAGLTQLQRLYFYHTGVTDAGLTKLRPLKNLEILHLGQTGVTFSAASEFEKDLPRSPIIR